MRLDAALALAERGFHVFPCEPNGKLPIIKDYPNRATRDPDQIRKWFAGTPYNIGISTSRFGDDQALVVVDVDNKKGKAGDQAILALELEGFELPESFETATPSGGRHIVYVAKEPCRQGVNVLGEGLDIRSRGGYIVGVGSEIDGRAYKQINGHFDLASAPDWLVHRLGVDRPRPDHVPVAVDGVDPDRAVHRAIEYLRTAPRSVKHRGGDETAYKVACKLKDFGCTEQQVIDLMLSEHWDNGCGWQLEKLVSKPIHNAFKYGREPAGISAPEAVFTPVVKDNAETDNAHPVEKLNREFAFIKRGAFVLQETTDEHGRFATERCSPQDMHLWFANKPIQVGEKNVPLSKLWFQSPVRREYDAVVFAPAQTAERRWYNLWRGFTVEPATTASHPSVDAFLDHALHNVCHGDKTLCHWLIGFFAHMIQRPYEKPLVALVFRGAKGVGKNALVERVGYLLGDHFLVADDQRYLLSNFNSHLESNLFFVLDEASWAGDKRAEGRLKGLITGGKHVIERKGAEPYQVANLTRVAIIGNETWLVPATVDERRFAVFNVGDGRKQDRKFFTDMRVGMERGGYAHLLRYLLDFDLTSIDVNDPPATQGLIDQKHASLDPLPEWWLDCLSSNSLVGGTWDGDLPPEIPSNRMREAFENWARGRNIRQRLPGRKDFNALMGQMAPHLPYAKSRPEDPKDSTYAFKNPGIAALRQDWETYIGGSHRWDE